MKEIFHDVGSGHNKNEALKLDIKAAQLIRHLAVEHWAREFFEVSVILVK